MDAELINPFLSGTQSTILAICGEQLTLGKLFVKPHPYICEPVSIEINIKGDLNGTVVFTMKNDVACYIASKMMFGMEVSQLDEMSQSAVSELGNMISGNVATIFSGKGKSIDITPPVFRMNATHGDFNFTRQGCLVVCVPLSFLNGGVFEVDIHIRE